MNTGNYKEVYITRDSDSDRIEIWNPNIGIAKFVGCVEFYSARAVGIRCVLRDKQSIGRLGCIDLVGRCNCGTCKEERVDLKELGFTPPAGTAWLYNATTGKRTRVDKEMALICPDTGKVLD
jgi:hypothetical protein